MSKAKITFDLSDADDLADYKIVNQANSMYWALWDIMHNTKKSLEYRFEVTDNSNNDVFDGIDAVFEELCRIVYDEHKINLE